MFLRRICKNLASRNRVLRAASAYDRTVRSWVSERFPVPRHIAMLVNLTIETETTEEGLRP
jgi:hypothetical protein